MAVVGEISITFVSCLALSIFSLLSAAKILRAITDDSLTLPRVALVVGVKHIVV